MLTAAFLIGLVIALVLATGFAFMPAWSSMAMIVVGFVVMIGFAFTLIGLLAELLIATALLGLTLRGAAHATSSLRGRLATTHHSD